VAEEGTITRAAERLLVAQPALSKQLRALERHVGVTLLDRRPHGVVLTEAGRALLEPARDALAAWDRGRGALRDIAGAGQLVIGMQTAVGRGLQRVALRRFAELAPGVTAALRLVPWSDPTAGLADGSSDVAFVWLPLPLSDVDVLIVATEQRYVALPADSRLASQDEVPFAALLDEPFVALPAEAGPLRDYWLGVDQRDGRPVRVGAVAETADAAFEAVASGLGVALVASGNADLYRHPGVVTRPVSGLPPAELALAWRVEERRPSVAAFVRAVEDAVTESG
jgi:DNA-binding transcriptional LysR family regulator